MSKLTFSEKDIETLSKNPSVLRVSDKSITYSDDFKRYFIEEYLQGKLPRVIFKKAGFDTEIIGCRRFEQAAQRFISR